MIYKVFNFNAVASFFDDAKDVDAKAKADALLTENKSAVLASEHERFTISSTFASENDTVWRNMLDTDPEEYTYQVFNTFTGQHVAYNTKTDALSACAELQEKFLASIFLDQVYELEALPTELPQPKSVGAQNL